MKGRRCDLANALAANWGAKVDPMPEGGAAVDLRSEPVSSGGGNIAPNIMFGHRHQDRLPRAPAPSISLKVRSRCHWSAARFMACSEEWVNSGTQRIADPPARRPWAG